MNRPRFGNQPRQPLHQQQPQPMQPMHRFPQQRFTAQASSGSNASFDSGRGSIGTGTNPSGTSGTIGLRGMNQGNPSRANQQQQNLPPVAEVLNDFDFDWGDDDDDFDMVLATQQVEAAAGASNTNPSYGVSPSRRDMTLENIRLELAFKESNGEDVRREDFMQDGVLGGNISHRQDPNRRTEAEKVAELERKNKELQDENYSCKGEVTNLRRLVNKYTQEKQRDIINRQARDEENKKKEAETKQKEKHEFESLRTNLRFTEKELRAQTERCEALKKQLHRLQALASQNTAGQVSSPSSSLNQSFNSSKILQTTSLSTIGFPNRNDFSARIGSGAAVPTVSASTSPAILPPSPKKQTSNAEVQTGPPSLDLEIARLEKECREAYELQQKLISDCIEQVSAATTRELRRMLPRIKEMAAGAENKLVKGLNLQGYRYELFFPDNLKVAEFILDEEARKSGGRPVVEQKRPKVKFPSQLEDWEETIGFDEGLQALLFAQKDIWGALCFVLDDLHRRIEFMRGMGNRNSLYRINNCVHFFKLLIWGANLWSNFFPMLWTAMMDPRKEFFQEIRKWSACILWVGNRNFEVEDVQIELRKLVLKSLTQVALKGLLHYTVANYLRLFNVISNTLNTPAHSTLQNLVECLAIAHALNRKKFLAYICRKRNDETCLAHQFALHAQKFFFEEKSLKNRFQLYKAYVEFLLSVREWCVVHSNGECGEAVEADDPDFFITNPVFNPPGTSNPSQLTNPEVQEATTSRAIFDSTINSMYLSEEISVVNLDSDGEEELEVEKEKEPIFKKPKLQALQRLQGARGGNPIPGCSKNLVDESYMEVDEEAEEEVITMGSYEDEWDATQQEVLEMNASQIEGSESPVRESEPCKKFLDCSLWEEDRRREGRVELCQCRAYLLETFMRMTEEVVYMWRHLKIYNECKTHPILAIEAEKREEQLFERLRSLEEAKAKKLVLSGKQKTREEFEEEMSLSLDSPFWRRIVNDSATVNQDDQNVAPEDVSRYLMPAVEIMYDSFNSAQNSISRAFGKEGANAFHISSAYLLRYAHDLGFSQELKSYLRQLTIVQAQVSQTDAENDFEEEFTQVQPESLFAEEFELKTVPKFDPNNPEIVGKLPPSLVQALTELQERKEECRRQLQQGSQEDDDTDYEDEEVNRQISKKLKKIDIGQTSSESESEAEEPNSDDEYATTDNSYDEEFEEDDKCDEEDNPYGKVPKKYRKVRDYQQFCGPTLEEGCYDSDEEFEDVQVTFQELKEAFPEEENLVDEKGLYVGYKSVAEVCAELENSGVVEGPLLEKPAEEDGGRINLEDQELEDFMKDLSSGLNYQGYYEKKTLVWDDYTKKGVPFKV